MANRKQPPKQITLEIATRDIATIKALEEERDELVAKIVLLNARINAARSALDRAQEYSASHGGELICPECLVRRNKKVRLHTVDTPRMSTILYECVDCHHEFQVPRKASRRPAKNGVSSSQ